MKWSRVYAVFLLICLTWRTGQALNRQDLIKPNLVPQIISSAINAAKGKAANASKKSAISGEFSLTIDPCVYYLYDNTKKFQ